MILLYLNTTNGEWFLEDGTSAGNGLPRIPYRNRETVGVQLVTATPGEDTEGVIPASDWPKDTQFSGAGGIAALLTTDNNYLRHLLGSLPQAVSAGSVAELSASLPGATPGIVPDAGFIRLFDNAGNYEELEYTGREIGENNTVTFTMAQGASLSSSYASGSPVDCGEGVYAQASLDSQNSDATTGYFQFDLYCYSKKLRLAVDYSDSREVEDVRGLELLVYSVSSLDGAVSIRGTWLCDGFSIPVPMALPPAVPEPSEEQTENLVAPTVAAMLAYGFALQFSVDGETDWHSTQDATADQFYRFRSKSGSGDWSDPILIPKGVDGEDGDDGKSAYQIWLDAGNTGTEAQFLASLKGDAGTSSYTYIAFASDANGSDFSLVQSDSLKYRAEIHTTTPIATPTASDFAGKWQKYLGDDGNGVDSATATTLSPGSSATASLVNKVLNLGIPKGAAGTSSYTYIAFASDSSGSDFSLTPSNLLKYIAIKVTSYSISNPAASDFAGLWTKYIGEDGDNAFTVDDALSSSSENAVQNKVIKAKLDQVDAEIAQNATAIASKQNNLSFDSAPTDNSNNPVTSDGIFEALKLKQDSLPEGVLDKFLKYGSNGLVWDTPSGGGSDFDARLSSDVVSPVLSSQDILDDFNAGATGGKLYIATGAEDEHLKRGHIYAVAFLTPEEAEEITPPSGGWGSGWSNGTYHDYIEISGGDNSAACGRYYRYRLVSGDRSWDGLSNGTYFIGYYNDAYRWCMDTKVIFPDLITSGGAEFDGNTFSALVANIEASGYTVTLPHYELVQSPSAPAADLAYAVYNALTMLSELKFLVKDITPCVIGTCPFEERIAALEEALANQ